MAIIYSYPIATPQDTDLLIISRTPTDPDEISNYSVNMSSVADYVIDRFIDPDATDFQIPVFNQGGNRITGSIMSQDSSPSNGVAGTKITIAGDLTLERDQSDTTLTLVSDSSNVDPGGEQHNPSIKFIQDGGAQNAAVGFNIIDDTGGGTIPGTGNRFWIVNAIDDSTGEGGITFGTAQVDGWENAIGRFIIRGDGKGLFGHPDSLYSKTLGSQFEIYDNRDENTTTDPSFSVYSVVDYAAPSGNEGAGGIKQILDVYNNGVFEGQEAMMLIPGTNSSDFAASTPLAFYTNSDMDTQGPSGFAGMIFDSGNWLLDSTYTNTDPGYKLKVAGNTNITGDVQIDTLTNNYIPVNNNQGVLRDSGFYQSPSTSVSTAGAVSLNTTFSDTNYGEIPGLRVASRVINTPGVIDLFRNDASVTTGESVGILQYSVLDDGRYAVAQIGVETLSTSGTGDSGGGKFLFKTAKGGGTGSGQNTPESRFTLDYNSADFLVPVNVTSATQSSFAGQVTIPETPIAGTDAASKAYVDLQNTGQVSGTGTTNTLPIWSNGPNGVLSDSGVSETRNGQGDIENIFISTNKAASPLNVNFGTGGTTSFKTGTTEFIKLTNQVNGFYNPQFRFGARLTVDRSNSSQTPSLDVGDADHTYPAAWFRNGVVISNNPSGVQVDNTSMVIGAGNNDNVSGSDHCLIVGSGNQITNNSDQSVAFGQGNTITSSIDSLAVGNSNNINSAQRVYALGYNNTISSGSSFVAGGQNTVGAGNTNIVIGFSNQSTGDSNFAIGNQLVSSDQEMVLGSRNNISEYPATDPSNGLSEVKFAVATGATTNVNSNALLITAGGKSGGSPTVPQVPRVILPTVVNFNFADDTAAAAGGIPVGGLYHNAGVIRIRLT